ncbi:MAG: family 1 glycosylhydrolase [Candidatus Dormibacteria bacterium]
MTISTNLRPVRHIYQEPGDVNPGATEAAGGEPPGTTRRELLKRGGAFAALWYLHCVAPPSTVLGSARRQVMAHPGAGLQFRPHRWGPGQPIEEFLVGFSTSATQVEGGGLNNNFTRWAQKRSGWVPVNPGGDHYNRVAQDLDLMKADGVNSYSLTIDWGRIEPTEGWYDEQALAHYRREIEMANARGITVVVNLLEYAIPTWLEDKGGILSPDAVDRFEKFSRLCADRFGDRVSLWTTMNEPNTQVIAGYLAGIWPPGESSVTRMCDAYNALLRMHAASARALHASGREHGRPARVSIAHIDDKAVAYQWWNPLDQAAALVVEYASSRWFPDSIAAGRALWPIGNGKTIKDLRKSMDWLGLDFYGRTYLHVTWPGDGRSGSPIAFHSHPSSVPDGTPYQADSDGIYGVGMELYNRYRLPLIVIENGYDPPTTPPGAEDLRVRAFIDTQSALWHLQEAGVPVFGSFQWTFCDTPEWQDGNSQHYGWRYTDRRPKPGNAVFAQFARTGTVPSELLTTRNLQSPAERDPYCAEQLGNLRRQQRWRQDRLPDRGAPLGTTLGA